MTWIDCGCDDFPAAARNRRMVRLKQNIDGYLFIEALVRSWPLNKPLPEQYYGYLPIVGKQEELYGFHEVGNFSEVNNG